MRCGLDGQARPSITSKASTVNEPSSERTKSGIDANATWLGAFGFDHHDVGFAPYFGVHAPKSLGLELRAMQRRKQALEDRVRATQNTRGLKAPRRREQIARKLPECPFSRCANDNFRKSWGGVALPSLSKGGLATTKSKLRTKAAGSGSNASKAWNAQRSKTPVFSALARAKSKLK